MGEKKRDPETKNGYGTTEKIKGHNLDPPLPHAPVYFRGLNAT